MAAAGDEDGGGEGNLAGLGREEGENCVVRAAVAGEAEALDARCRESESLRADEDEVSRDEGEWCGAAAAAAADEEVDRCRARPGDCW